MQTNRPRKARLALAIFLAAAAPSSFANLAACNALANVQLDNTTITSVQFLTSAAGNPYCEVAATVAPQQDIRIRLPEVWKDRYVQYGGGGFDGSIPNLSVPSSPPVSTGKDPVDFGYVVIASNGGHRNTDYPGSSFAIDRALTLAYATTKMYDTDLVGRALVRAYYGQPAKYHYFAGCSNGGKNASIVASKLTDNYDGVIGGDGVWGHAKDEVGGSDMPSLTARWVKTNQFGMLLSQQKGDALYQRSVDACDALDGLTDGVISNVEACPFKKVAQSMSCTAEPGNVNCLTDAELQNVDNHASSFKVGNTIMANPWIRAGNFGRFGNVTALPAGFLQMALRKPTSVDPVSFDLEANFLDMKIVLDEIYSMSGPTPDISNYLKKGKKLILFHGWEDMEVPPTTSLNFYKSLLRKDPKSAAENARLYMMPGMPHCRGGRGADASELLHVLAKWVEEGIAPNTPQNPVVAWERPSNNNTGPQGIDTAVFSRPLCPWPQYAAYSGTGDPNQASSFVCRDAGRPVERPY